MDKQWRPAAENMVDEATNKTVITLLKEQEQRNGKPQKAKKLRVAAYCRVSTDDEEQLSSYQQQIEYYTSKINENPDWEMAGIYADEGISGTSTKNREEFKKLMALCRRGSVDLILTKSISRFARNTVDCLSYVRKLKQRGVTIIFEKENINTSTMTSEMMITFYSSFAQAESESISKNVAAGKRMSFKRGEVKFQYKYLMGYRKGDDGEPEIIPEEAKHIERIFKQYLDGYSITRIRDELHNNNVISPNGKEKWSTSTIERILRNEKYCGDMLLQKTFVTDCISKKVKKNTGELPMYYVKNNHKPIIPREMFDEVQEEISRRNSKPAAENMEKQGRYSSKYALSELLTCGDCGSLYRRCTWTYKGEKQIKWRCLTRLQTKEQCPHSATISEDELHATILQAIQKQVSAIPDMQSDMLEILEQATSTGMEMTLTAIERMISDQTNERENILARMVELGADDESLDAHFLQITNSLRVLEEKKTEMMQANDQASQNQRMKEISEAIADDKPSIDEYDDALVRKLIKEVKVMSRTELEICFRDGPKAREWVRM